MFTTAQSMIITAIAAFSGNPHDSKTIKPLLDQVKKNQLNIPKEVVYDRGGKGQKQIGNTIISTPDNISFLPIYLFFERLKFQAFLIELF